MTTPLDIAENIGGALVGEAEKVGLRYPVKQYVDRVDDSLSRGCRISGPGESGNYAQLKANGFRGIVSLCAENDSDAAPAAAAGLNALRIPITDNTAPSNAQVLEFLRFATDPANHKCYVHCEAGIGRTGTMVACYRQAVLGWTPEAALAEARGYGLAMPCQAEFIKAFGEDLRAGRIPGFTTTSEPTP